MSKLEILEKVKNQMN